MSRTSDRAGRVGVCRTGGHRAHRGPL